MNQLKTDRLAGILNNEWAVTLLSTMIGVIGGLYLTDIFEERSLLKAKKHALTQVHQELSDNRELLKSYHEDLTRKHESMEFFISQMKEDLELIIPEDALEGFLEASGPIFNYSHAEPTPNGELRIRGDLNLYINSPLVARGLSQIIWSAYKQTDYMSVTEFRCLTDIESVYSLQNEVNQLNTEWKNLFYQGTFIQSADSRADFMNKWRGLLVRQGLLLEFYGLKESVLKNCN